MTNYRILTTEYLTESISDLINSKVRKGYNVTFSNSENFCRSGLIDNNPASLVCCGTNFDWYNKPNEIGMKGWSIRACPKRSIGRETTGHQFDHGNAYHALACFCQVLIIFG